MNLVPPPPPLPPVFDKSSSSDSSEKKITADWATSDNSSECFHTLWESTGAHLTTENPEKHTFTFIQGCQQIGPTCGLAALWMVTKHLDVDVSSQKILELAVKKKITSFGEMFSAENLRQLAQEVLGPKADTSLMKGDLKEKIPEVLFEDHLIIIPYDTDKNNEPCVQDGRKAHWAILCGVVSTKSNMFVIARQSKSRLLSIWNLEKLIDSNTNLKIPDENLPSGSIVPSEGLSESLANQFVVIKKK